MASEIQLPRSTSRIQPERDSPKSRPQRRIVVCRGRSCRKYQAEQVFDKFGASLPEDIELLSVPCLGECGNGSMVVVEPEHIWYWQVDPDEVKTVIQQHIIGKSPVKAMLYPKFHQ